jgi:hypothetical protein
VLAHPVGADGDEVGDLGGAFGGAVASSVLAPLIAQRRERRDLRAEVLPRVADVETARWMPRDHEDFRQATTALRAAALVAAANRELIDRYLYLAAIARRTSESSWYEHPEDEGGGGISVAIAELVNDAAAAVVDHVWHPVRRRGATKRVLSESQRREQALRASQEDSFIRTVWPSGTR